MLEKPKEKKRKKDKKKRCEELRKNRTVRITFVKFSEK